MEDIQLIKVNTDNAIYHCDELLNELSNLESLKHSLEYIVNTDIPTIWTSDTADVTSLSNNLRNNAIFLGDFIKFSKEFSTTLQDYATALKAIGNEGDGTLGGTTGAGTEPTGGTPDETGAGTEPTGETPDETGAGTEPTGGTTGGEEMVNGPLGSGTSFRDAGLEATGKQFPEVDATTSASQSNKDAAPEETKNDVNITEKKDSSQILDSNVTKPANSNDTNDKPQDTIQPSNVDATTSASPSSSSQIDSSIGQRPSIESNDTNIFMSGKEINDSLMDSYEDSFINHSNIFTGNNTSDAEVDSGPKLVDEGVGPGFTYKVYKE